MQIFIMRHGEAEHFASADEQRALTENGKKASKLMAQWLSEQINSLDLVLVSPYLRAQETWQSCTQLLTKTEKVLTEKGITPYGDSEQVASYVKALIDKEKLSSILLISHLPLVSYLAAEFDSSIHSLAFSTSAVCQIEFDTEKQRGEVITLKSPLEL